MRRDRVLHPPHDAGSGNRGRNRLSNPQRGRTESPFHDTWSHALTSSCIKAKDSAALLARDPHVRIDYDFLTANDVPRDQHRIDGNPGEPLSPERTGHAERQGGGGSLPT